MLPILNNWVNANMRYDTECSLIMFTCFPQSGDEDVTPTRIDEENDTFPDCTSESSSRATLTDAVRLGKTTI